MYSEVYNAFPGGGCTGGNSRAFLEQTESWRTESAEMWAMEVEEEDEA